MIPRFDEVRDIPLVADEAVLERVGALIGRARERQLWLMLLDERARQYPVVIPMRLPRRPRSGDSRHFAAALGAIVADLEVAAIVIGYERRGRDALTEDDRAWLTLARDAAAAAGIPLRGPILAHDRGVRWIGAEDMAGAPVTDAPG